MRAKRRTILQERSLRRELEHSGSSKLVQWLFVSAEAAEAGRYREFNEIKCQIIKSILRERGYAL
jgi:hypothetical protein